MQFTLQKSKWLLLFFLCPFFFSHGQVCPSVDPSNGLHYTQAEVEVWRQRAKGLSTANYKSKHDVQLNSPGDWDRIVDGAKKFLASPSADRWTGDGDGQPPIPLTQCVDQSKTDKTTIPVPQDKHHTLVDAAFYYLITGDVVYANAVKGELLAQAAEQGTNFGNTTHWCRGESHDQGPAFATSEWLTRLLFAYDYIKPVLTCQEVGTLNTWFGNAADYVKSNYDPDLDGKFENRWQGLYKLTGYNVNGTPTPNTPAAYEANPDPTVDLMYYGGTTARHITKVYNNRRAAMASFVGLWGLKSGNASYKDSGKQFFKEFLMFSVYPKEQLNGTVFPNSIMSELHRGMNVKYDSPSIIAGPDKGFAYCHGSLAKLILLADGFARTGDYTLYEYQTTGGTTTATSGADATAVPPGGTPKSLLGAIKGLCDLRNGVTQLYGTRLAAENGTLNYLLDGVNIQANQSWYGAYDIWFGLANLYYKDPYVKATYLRNDSQVKALSGNSAAAAKDYPASIALAGDGISGYALAGIPAFLFTAIAGRFFTSAITLTEC